MCFAPQQPALFGHPIAIESLKSGPNPWCFLNMFTLKCASRHKGVHFFDIKTSKSGPSMVCFVHVHFQMCFAPQPRAVFRKRNFQKRSEAKCFGHFDFHLCFAPQWLAFFRHVNFQKPSFHFKMCSAPQRRAIFHLSSGDLAPHPPL